MKFKLLSIFLFFALYAIAQQDSSFTVRQAIELALKQNLDLQLAESDLEIAKVNNTWGNAGALPTLAANVSNSEAVTNIDQKLANGSSITRNNVSNSVINSNLTITWRIFNGLRVRTTKDRFETLEKIGEIALALQIDQTVFDVSNTYYEIVRLKQQTIATKAIIDLSKERLKIAETRFNVGSGSKTDLLQAKIDLNAQLINLENIQNNLSNLKASINVLLKRSPSDPFFPVEEKFDIPNINYDELIQKLDTQNKQILFAQQEKINLIQDKKIINSQRLPQLSLNSTTLLNRSKSTAGFFLTNQTFGPNIGLGLAIPIFNGNINKTQLKVNSIQQDRQDVQIEQLKNNLKRDFLIAYQNYQNALDNSKIEEENVKVAEENNMISTERFRKLQSNSIELRQAQLSLIEAKDRYINAQFQAQIASNILKFLSGEISKL